MRLSRCIAALALGAATVLRAQLPTATGRVVFDTLHSKALEKNLYGDSPDRAVNVYLPSSYESQPSRRYPVVYLLHGFGSSERFWLAASTSIPRAMDSLVARGVVREMIIVMPNGRNRFDGSFYTNSSSGGNWDDFITQELVGYIDHKYRTIARPESRGIGGHSMGGYGAFALGMRHGGDVYGAVYALSGCCTRFQATAGERPAAWETLLGLTSLDQVARLQFYPKVYLALSVAFAPDPGRPPFFANFPFVLRDGVLQPVGNVSARWADHAPYDMIPTYREQLLRLNGLAFDVGMSDQLVPPAEVAQMDSAFTRAGITHTFETYDGDHGNRIGVRLATRVLPFFSRTLDFRLP